MERKDKRGNGKLSWKHTYHYNNVTIGVYNRLVRRGYGEGLYIESPTVGFDFEDAHVHNTTPDLSYPRVSFFIFFDGGLVEHGKGKLHLSEKQEKKDELINAALSKRGIIFERFPYVPPASKALMDEMTEKIISAYENLLAKRKEQK